MLDQLVEVLIVSQEQKDRVEQPVEKDEAGELIAETPAPLASSTSAEVEGEEVQAELSQATETTGEKKSSRRKGRWVNAEEIIPRPSYWPLALAVSLIVLLLGLIIHPIVLGVGVVLIIASVIGWMLERR